MILVTGGAGYIGSHTCLELLAAGYEVVVVDNLSNGKREALRRVEALTGRTLRFYQTDVHDQREMKRIFAETSIEAVIHLAGFKAVGESTLHPLPYYYNNIVSTLVLCDVMRTYGVKRMVFSSSASVYGDAKSMPVTENAPLRAQHPYGRTKQMIEVMLRDIAAADPFWSVALLRYFNPIGAHPSGRIGEDPNGIPNNLVPYITQVAVGKLKEVRIFGGDYPTPDGTGVRDYIHVVDLALGHLKALEMVLTQTGAEAYNLGTGTGYSVLQVIDAFRKVTGREILYKVEGRRPGDVPVSYSDPRKARVELGWRAEQGLEAMCADAWNWQLKNPGGYV